MTEHLGPGLNGSPHAIQVRAAGRVVFASANWESLSGRMGEQGEEEREVSMSRYELSVGAVPVEISVAHDMTEQRRTERQLEESQKLEALGRWVGGVVHDFNNLLTAVMLYSGLLAQNLDAGSAEANYNEEIRVAAQRGADLIQQLLAFARNSEPKSRIVSLNSLLKGTRDVLRRMIGEDIEVIYELSRVPCNVRIDPVEIQQVVFNLALNARDAMPAGGRLTMQTKCERSEGDDAGKVVHLTVTDTGCGMDEKTLARAFEPFFTTKPKGKGTGLGLTTVHKIIQQRGGRVLLESTLERGTCVTVILPAAEGARARTTSSVAPANGDRGSETILLVEDDDSVRSSIRDMLFDYGYRVFEAANGYEAREAAKGLDDEIDMLLTDIVLPGISGRELARELQQLNPELKVLLISGYGEHAGSSSNNVFPKPFTKEALARRVRSVLDTKS